jgi:hypothetical protein
MQPNKSKKKQFCAQYTVVKDQKYQVTVTHQVSYLTLQYQAPTVHAILQG